MMTWQPTPFILLYLSGFSVALVVAYLSFRMRPVRGSLLFSIMALGIACWIGGFILGFFNSDLGWKVASLRVEYIGIIITPVFLFLFVTRYVQIRIPLIWLLALVLPGVATLLVVLTFPYHQLLYLDYGVRELESGFVVFQKTYGPVFYFWLVLSYALMLASGVVLATGLANMPARYGHQAGVIGLAIAIVLVANIAFISGLNPIAPYDPTPLTFLVASILVLINMRAYRFLDIVPVAHNLVFDQVPTGVVVLNELSHIIDANRAAEEAFGVPARSLFGQSIDDWLPLSQSENHDEVAVGSEGRLYAIDFTPLKSRDGQLAGRIVLLHDVTERIRMNRRQQDLITELQAAMANVRMLEGMLPMCANCKQIRDEDGQWHELQTFIHDHSSAEFSHGICPTCSVKLYPEWQEK